MVEFAHAKLESQFVCIEIVNSDTRIKCIRNKWAQLTDQLFYLYYSILSGISVTANGL